MNKIITIGLVIFILLIISINLSLTYPKFKELNQFNLIYNELEKANYCQVDSDCVNVGNKCPFGCYIYVNKNEFEKISELFDSYNSDCVYDCISCQYVVCKNNKCKKVCN